jgi:hypothetical protein
MVACLWHHHKLLDPSNHCFGNNCNSATELLASTVRFILLSLHEDVRKGHSCSYDALKLGSMSISEELHDFVPVCLSVVCILDCFLNDNKNMILN